MCTETQLNRITKAMVDCYRVVYGEDVFETLKQEYPGKILIHPNLQ